METFPKSEIKEDKNGEELDCKKIQRLFVEMPSDKVELLANHLARPDGFSKALIVGSIATSAELQKKIDNEFVKTHRGHYMSMTPFDRGGENDYISFNVGRPQRLYQESTFKKRIRSDWKGGLGFAMPARKLLAYENVKPSWGMFNIYESLKHLRQSGGFESNFEKYSEISEQKAQAFDMKPPKDDFLTLVHIARKAGGLKGSDQAEINMEKENDQFPRLSLDEGIIFIPQKSKNSFKRYLEKKIKESIPYTKKLSEVFNIDVSELSAEKVLKRYPNIYWYPQENIDLAVEYLSTHPGAVSKFLKKSNDTPTETP